MEKPIKKLLGVFTKSNERGVTLLEMVAAMTIIAFMLAVLAQFLFSGVRLWGQQDSNYRQQHRLTMIRQILNYDLSSLLVGNYLPEDSVRGDDLQLQFWSEAADGLVLVTYYYDPEQQTVFRCAGFWGQKAPEVPLFKEITEWKFAYFESKGKNWTATWKATRKNEIPALIRVTACAKTGNLGTLTFSVKAWHEEDEE
jgi:prepilin-type N-terminal cleavage/methylation domain-containing protein